MYEFVSIEGKKKKYAQKYDKKAKKFLVVSATGKAFSVAMWLLPALVITIKLSKHLIIGGKAELYEFASVAITCFMFVVCLGLGKWLLAKVARKASVGTVFQRNQEKVVIITPKTMEYSFSEFDDEKVVKLELQGISINEQLGVIEIDGIEKALNNSLVKINLYDYYEPELIDSIKILGSELL